MEAALRGVGASRFVSNLVGGVATAAAGVALQQAPAEVRDVADAAGELLGHVVPTVPGPLPREMDAGDQAAQLLAQVGVTPGQVNELVRVGERVGSAFERLDELVALYTSSLEQLHATLKEARVLVEVLKAAPATAKLQRPATRKPRAPKA
jgi:hypothetical protein